MTIRQSAKSCGVGYGTMLRLVKDGLVRSVQIPGRQYLLVDPADLTTFIEASKSGSLSGSSEKVEVEKLQSSSAQKEKSQRRMAGGVPRLELPYYLRFKAKNAC